MLHLRTLFENIHGAQAGCSEQSSEYGIGSTAVEPLSGVYLHGSVGSGKTMLMDLFVEACGDAAQRLHFHELMLEVHAELHRLHMSRPRTVVQSKFGLPMFKFGDMEEAGGSASSTTNDGREPHGRAPLSGGSTANEGRGGGSNSMADSTAEAQAAGKHDPHVESFIDGPLASSSREDSGVAQPPPSPPRPPPPPPPPSPLTRVIERIASRGPVLCLDEMQVTDVADAMLLRQLFEGLFDRNVRVVFTSNRQPEELYERGLNRKYFLPFVKLVRDRCAVIRVGAAGAGALDYRSLPLDQRVGLSQAITSESRRALAPRPLGTFTHGPHAEAKLKDLWEAHCSFTSGADRQNLRGASQQQQQPQPQPFQSPATAASRAAATVGGTGELSDETGELSDELIVAFGRKLRLRARSGGACWFSFDELCARRPGMPSLGAADYLALSRAARGIYLSGVPVLEGHMRNEARRFVTLIDTLYEARVELHVAAKAPVEDIVRPLLERGAEAAGEGAEGEGGRELDGSYFPNASTSAEAASASAAAAPVEPSTAESSEKEPSFEEAPVGGRFRTDGELAAFFTGKDEAFMLRRTVSRLKEMCNGATAAAPTK